MNTPISATERAFAFFLFLVLFILILVLILKFTRQTVFDPPKTFYFVVSEGCDLETNDVVKINGLKSGFISSVEPFRDGSIGVALKIQQHSQLIKEDSHVQVYPPLLFQKPFVNITLGQQNSPPLVNGETLKNVDLQTNLNQSLGKLSVEIDQSSRVLGKTLRDLETGVSNIVNLTNAVMNKEGSLGSILNDNKKLYQSLQNLLDSSQLLLKKMQDSSDSVNLVSNEIPGFITTARTVLGQISQSVGDISDLQTRVASSSLELPLLLHQMRNIFSSVEEASKYFPQLSSKSDVALDKFNSTFKNFDGISNELEGVTSRLNSILEKIDLGKGSAGALVNDRKLFDDSKKAMNEFKEIVEDINRTETFVGLNSMWYPGEDYNRYEGYLNIQSNPEKSFTVGLNYLEKSGNHPAFWSTADHEDHLIRPTIEIAQKFSKNKNYNIRIGVMEGEPGVGIDYEPAGHRGAFVLEARGPFTKQDPIMARMLWRYRVNSNLKFIIGANDLLEHPEITFGLNYSYKDEDITKIIRIFGTGR